MEFFWYGLSIIIFIYSIYVYIEGEGSYLTNKKELTTLLQRIFYATIIFFAALYINNVSKEDIMELGKNKLGISEYIWIISLITLSGILIGQFVFLGNRLKKWKFLGQEYEFAEEKLAEETENTLYMVTSYLEAINIKSEAYLKIISDINENNLTNDIKQDYQEFLQYFSDKSSQIPTHITIKEIKEFHQENKYNFSPKEIKSIIDKMLKKQTVTTKTEKLYLNLLPYKNKSKKIYIVTIEADTELLKPEFVLIYAILDKIDDVYKIYKLEEIKKSCIDKGFDIQ